MDPSICFLNATTETPTTKVSTTGGPTMLELPYKWQFVDNMIQGIQAKTPTAVNDVGLQEAQFLETAGST